MGTVRYGMALLTLMFLPGGLLYWFSIHPFVRFWRGVGLRATSTAHILMIAAVACVVYLLRGRLLAVEYGTNLLLIAISLPLLITSVVLRRALGRHLTLRILAGIPELAAEPSAQPLLCEGIYARIRHPRYLELFTLLLFCALFTNYLAGYVTLAASVPVLLAIIHIEERELRDRFGEEYVRYCARVLVGRLHRPRDIRTGSDAAQVDCVCRPWRTKQQGCSRSLAAGRRMGCPFLTPTGPAAARLGGGPCGV